MFYKTASPLILIQDKKEIKKVKEDYKTLLWYGREGQKGSG
ncbi:MAG: Unknown protein [uncultured Campylobacterales bacterium]|uniref:Uncharacterized protein n=1 Tax=uncultured Campylobacterales bacterium TaxID=352960 RepID=A0A6S6SSR4_9BACT|nr:MAG: Unknown protein [uncultured Campylobacterales bacterium]